MLASFEEHCNDCERLLGDRCAAVNGWMDEGFKIFGSQHRFWRHHWNGVKQAEALFGALGRKAAMVRILKDCGRVPKARDWERKPSTQPIIIPPSEGMMANWKSQEEFDRAAKGLLDG